MKNFDSRVYSINDLVEWDKRKQAELASHSQDLINEAIFDAKTTTD
jgi:hypothetical protein